MFICLILSHLFIQLYIYFHLYLPTQENQAHVSVLCEYDALPEIGHACGHNLIAECGVAAGIGIKAAMDNAGRNIGKVFNGINNISLPQYSSSVQNFASIFL